MSRILNTLGTPEGEPIYYGFLRDRTMRGDHTFLLGDIKRSNLRPSVQAVLFELIEGKINRPRGKLPTFLVA